MIFPDCEIHDCDQRTPEWFKLREGNLTASKFGAWLSKNPDLKGTISARKTAVYQALADLSRCPKPPDFEVDVTGAPPKSRSSLPIWRGIVLEKFASEEFEFQTGMKLDEVGFCSWNHGKVSVSPDGKIRGVNQGFETKSPDVTTHLKYLDEGILPAAYEPQVHGSMAVTGADSWWFMSYCPNWRWSDEFRDVEILPGGEPPFILEVKRSELTERYTEGLKAFDQELTAAKKRMAEIWKKPAFVKPQIESII